MKFRYMVKYVWLDIWHKQNRPFTLINLLALTITTTVLVVLLGGFLAFRRNSEQLLDRQSLSIEITTKGEGVIAEAMKQQLAGLQGMASLQWWTPTIFLFYTQDGRLCDGISGRTVAVSDPLLDSLRDLRNNQTIRFLGRKELGHGLYDELGIIVPFLMLKQLAYLPPAASWSKPETWKAHPLPTKIKFMIRESRTGATPVDIELPVVGIVADIEGGRYLITKDCYRILGSGWNNAWRSQLKDRRQQLLFADAKGSAGQEPLAIAKLPAPPDTHGTAYVKQRSNLLPLLKSIRDRGLKADCAMEYTLRDYQQQETFFIAAGGGICWTLFFFSGVILFATSQAMVLRKLKEIGILKACGASKPLVHYLFAMQTTLISGMASIFGIILGTGCAVYLAYVAQTYLQLAMRDYFLVPWPYLTGIWLFDIVFCLLITFFPVYSCVRLDPDQVMKG